MIKIYVAKQNIDIAKKLKKEDHLTLKELLDKCDGRINEKNLDLNKNIVEYSLQLMLDTKNSSAVKPAKIKTETSVVIPAANVQTQLQQANLEHKIKKIDELIAADEYLETLEDHQAVKIAYKEQSAKASSYLNNQLSVLIEGDKILFAYFLKYLKVNSKLIGLKEISEAYVDMPINEALLSYIHANAKETNWILILDRIDVWSHTGSNTFNDKSRSMVEILYQYPNLVVIGCIDRTLTIPEVLKKRFDVRIEISTIKRDSLSQLITKAEVNSFSKFDPDDLYKNVAGLNVIQLRHALRYVQQSHGPKKG